MVSAVPAGEVMARDDVLGHSRPCAATIGTTSIEVRLPGMPPMQCLSTTRVSCQSRLLPHGDHGLGQEIHLLAVQFVAVGGDHEGGQLDF